MAPAGFLAFVSSSIRIVSCVVLFIGLLAVGLGLWTIYKGEGPLVDYLKTEQQREKQKMDTPWYETIGGASSNTAEAEMTIQVIGGLLIGAGCVLIIDFALGMFASSQLLAGCCVPAFLAFAMVSCLIFAGCGVAALTVLEPALRAGLSAVFENDLEMAVSGTPSLNGPLRMAQTNFDCCGPKNCRDYGVTSNKFVYLTRTCSAACIVKKGCVDAVLDNYILQYRLTFAVGCFGISGITALMFIFSLILCCCSN